MLDHLDLQKILFLDIETVPFVESYSNLDNDWRSLWERKASFLSTTDEDTAESLFHRAGIYAEFGKVICVSLGFFNINGNKREFRLRSVYGDNEQKLLEELSLILDKFYKGPEYLLCAHNGKEFDFPFLARRILINNIQLPHLLDIAGRKPWEVQHLDTMNLWKFGDYKNYTSLKLLCKLFNIESPKNDMDGSQVAEVYYKDKDLKRIIEYCQNDTLAVAQLLLRYMGKELIKKKEMVVVK